MPADAQVDPQGVSRSGRPAPVQLLPLFRSQTQLTVLRYLLLRDDPRTISDLARLAGVSKPSAQAEVDRLESAGIVASRRQGRNRLVRAVVSGPVREALETLVLYAEGPVMMVAEELAQVAHIDAAYVYGSWAERYLRIPGRVPNDIDVLVIGSPDRDDVFEAADRAQRRLGLGLDVNATVVSRRAWDSAESPFLKQVRSQALVELPLPDASGERTCVTPQRGEQR